MQNGYCKKIKKDDSAKNLSDDNWVQAWKKHSNKKKPVHQMYS